MKEKGKIHRSIPQSDMHCFHQRPFIFLRCFCAYMKYWFLIPTYGLEYFENIELYIETMTLKSSQQHWCKPDMPLTKLCSNIIFWETMATCRLLCKLASCLFVFIFSSGSWEPRSIWNKISLYRLAMLLKKFGEMRKENCCFLHDAFSSSISSGDKLTKMNLKEANGSCLCLVIKDK